MTTRDASTQVTAVKTRFVHRPYYKKTSETTVDEAGEEINQCEVATSTAMTATATGTKKNLHFGKGFNAAAGNNNDSGSDNGIAAFPGMSRHSNSGDGDDANIPVVQASSIPILRPRVTIKAPVVDGKTFPSLANPKPPRRVDPNYSDNTRKPHPVTHGGKPTVACADVDELQNAVGVMSTLARTAQGSSFLQAALRTDRENSYSLIFTELYPHFADLMLDDHGCYVIRALLELLPIADATVILHEFSAKDTLWVNLATRSLHTRRMIQFVAEHFKDDALSFLIPIVMRHFTSIAFTPQGCVSLQRIFDCCSHPDREAMFNLVRMNLIPFMEDKSGAYVVQYMLQYGDHMANIAAFQSACGGRYLELACNKYISSLFEKAIQSLGGAFHTLLLAEADQLPDSVFCAVLNDGYGNYVIQALIACADLNILTGLSNRIQRLLPYIVYGQKLSQRLSQRMIHLRRKTSNNNANNNNNKQRA